MRNNDRSSGMSLIALGILGIFGLAIAVYFWAHRFGEVPTPPNEANNTSGDLFGAIEVGGSGIKGTVFQLTRRRARELIKAAESEDGFRHRIFEEQRKAQYPDLNTKLKDDVNIAIAADYVATLAQKMHEDFAITPNRIYVALSSGIANLPHLEEIKKAIHARSGLRSDVVAVAEECRLTFDWIVPGTRAYDVVVVDVGSQNTKACYKEETAEGPRIRSFELLSWGVKSFESKVNESAASEPFETVSARERAKLQAHVAQMASGNAGLRGRKRLYLVGGAAWATATLVRPEEARTEWVRLSAPTDFETLRRQAVENRAFDVETAGISNAEARDILVKDISKLKLTYTKEQLVAASDILIAISMALHLREEKEAVFFARPSAYAWMSRYLLEKVADTKSDLP